MQIKITARGTEVSAPLKDYVHQKVGKLEGFFNNIQKIEVILEARSIGNVERRQVVEIRAWLAGLKTIQATEAGRDMYAAIDLVVEEAKRQIQRHKDRLTKEQRKKGSKLRHNLSALETEEVKDASLPLVRVDTFMHKPMDLSEAQEELKVLERDFLVFRNLDTREINVVHKNKGQVELLRAEKEMIPEEAMEDLKKSGEVLTFFNNKTTRVPSVVFRRKAGNFGLIEPEI